MNQVTNRDIQNAQQARTNGHLSSANGQENTLLLEIAYEVANQVGGIYTVIRSKVPSMLDYWGDRYCAIGPYVHPNVTAIFEPSEDYDHPIGKAVLKMREMGYEVHYGHWLIDGRPRTVLFNPYSVYDRLGEIKYLLWEHHSISTPGDDDLINQVVAFGFLVKVFVSCLTEPDVSAGFKTVVHVHEWMAGTVIPELRRDQLPVHTVFTTHATLLGRYLAMNAPDFYGHLPFFDWAKEAEYFNIQTQIQIERSAAHGAHVFTTVSEVTARECEYLVGRKPEVILPNGFNVKRYDIRHEVQNQHQLYKEEIHKFVMGQFFHNYSFDLDNTLYFFTSGRFEYRNKGYDLTLEALARLNWRMKQANTKKTVVMFLITKRPFHSINPNVLQSHALMEKIRETTENIQKQIGNKLFMEAALQKDSSFPDLNQFIDENWKVRFRRNVQTWKSQGLPTVVTHNLADDGKDPVLNFLRASNLVNHEQDKVKMVYHPDFISSTNPLFGIDYHDFVRGCHLGIFPSYYEPWGYTPLESIASGVPAVTSDLSGFGDYVSQNLENPEECGLYVVNRTRQSFDEAANQLADILFKYVQMNRLDRITQRYESENGAMYFSWRNLTKHYFEAYEMALQR